MLLAKCCAVVCLMFELKLHEDCLMLVECRMNMKMLMPCFPNPKCMLIPRMLELIGCCCWFHAHATVLLDHSQSQYFPACINSLPFQLVRHGITSLPRLTLVLTICLAFVHTSFQLFPQLHKLISHSN